MSFCAIGKAVVSLTILLAKYAFTMPNQRTLLELDISNHHPGRITVLPSVKNPGGTNYAVRRNSNFSHVIGAVFDEGELIVEGDKNAMSRYVLVRIREDGSKYVRVMTRYRECRRFLSYIQEFSKGIGEPKYKKVSRELMTLDVLDQKTDETIQVTSRMGSEPDMPVKEYCVQPKLLDKVVIGAVTYGNYLVEDKVSGLISRKVIWEGGEYYPRIIIQSQYKDSKETEAKYEFNMGKVDKFSIYEIKTVSLSVRG
ncbi:signal peptide containing protein [Theileria equi strain WA]|uniref:Signal peptide containing protein n=1 Tax=Theileria equi strain WA TaxID=1537102 RepID=L1LDV0_THEEQ|nr:signal peptide containing protein [Theileria equi strain WA]EKX73531.1 signal peptide containing protein [Theileria equi strain WA]|eukprot:XP_004832983.1 signal peptide containing protein [Theileria equi strain WA]